MSKRTLFFLVTISVTGLILAFTTKGRISKLNNYSNLNDSITPLLVKAKDHKGQSIVSSAGVITFTSGLDNDFYLEDSANRTGYLYIETKLSKFTNSKLTKTPLNISIVIDRSGSMAGPKMDMGKMDFAKKAAKGIVDKLDSNDHISVVIYDNFISVVQKAIPDTNKKMIKDKIDQIMPRGSTNLWGGTEKGYSEVLENYMPDRINRVLLISDGQANVGLTDPRKIGVKVQEYRDSGVSLSTFGVGLDYNELLMTRMAEIGTGNYYFIDSASKLTTLFDKELNGLLNIAAQNAELRIKVPQGVKVEAVYPFKFEVQGDEIVFKFRDLSSEETKGILLRFKVADKLRSNLKFSSSITYTDVTDQKVKTLTNENLLKPVKKKDTYLNYFNKYVIEQAILFYANENLENAMEMADAGDYNGAKKILDANASFLRSNAFYVNESDELRKMDETNMNYSAGMLRAKKMSKDSINLFQKANREAVYKIRNKKG